MSNVVIDIAAEFTGKKAFKQADTAAQKLTKTVGNLAKGFGITFSARALAQYSKQAVAAFAADDKAAKILTRTLSNLGLVFADPAVKTFISDLEKQYGVLDDFLRPAYQKLVTTTGDWRKSQELLRTSLDLSAQSGFDVVSVADDISRAFAGNTKGLQKYGLGLSKAQLSAMSFEEVLVRITKISNGQAALAASTYAGKLDILNVAAANASETIGGALVDSFVALAGNGNIEKATTNIDIFSKTLAALISPKQMAGIMGQVDYKFGIIPTIKKPNTNRSASPAGTFLKNQAEIRAAAAAKKQQADMLAANKKAAKLAADQLKLAKAKAIFDNKNIQIEAALKGKISEEERARLLLMKAIADENISLIDKYTKALAAAQSETKNLQNVLDSVKITKFENPAGSVFYRGLTQAQIDLEKFKESGGFRLKWDGSEYYKGLTQGEIDLEKFKEKGGFRLKWNATDYYYGLSESEYELEKFKERGLFRLNWDANDYYSGLTQSEIDLEKFKEKGGFRLGWDANDYYYGLSQSEIELERFKESGQFRLTWDATDFYNGMTAAEITWERWKESGYTGGKPASPASISNLSNFSNMSSLPSNSTQNTNSNSMNNVFNININTGIGDPNAIAEAVDQVLQDAVNRGTLRLR